MEHDVAAVILAGGQSRRLGVDKAALRIDGVTLLARTVETVSFCREVVIVTPFPKKHTHPLARSVSDLFPGKGVLGAMYTGLAAASAPFALMVGVDMPFLSRRLLMRLIEQAAQYDVVVPVIGGLVEPLHAVYRNTCLAPMRHRLAGSAVARAVSFYPDVSVCEVGEDELRSIDPELLSLFNVNTPSDLERAQAILRQQGHTLE